MAAPQSRSSVPPPGPRPTRSPYAGVVVAACVIGLTFLIAALVIGLVLIPDGPLVTGLGPAGPVAAP